MTVHARDISKIVCVTSSNQDQARSASASTDTSTSHSSAMADARTRITRQARALWHAFASWIVGIPPYFQAHWPAVRSWIKRRKGLVRSLLIAAFVVIVLEVFPFNLRFWTSLGRPAPLDLTDTSITYGTGLEHAAPGVLTVLNGTDDQIQVSGLDTSVDTIHMISHEPAAIDSSAEHATASSSSPRLDMRGWVSVRIKVLPVGSSVWHTGPELAYSPRVPASTYLPVDDSYGPISALRIWFLQPVGTSFNCGQVRINERAGFHFSWLRVGIMVFIALFGICFIDPRSGIYRVPFDMSVSWQFGLVALLMVPLIAGTAGMFQKVGSITPPSVFAPVYGNYVYDGDQYSRLADALIHGHPWLDLPVPRELAQARNPYSLAMRAQLLSQGVTPIFWDHVIWGGKWYCYFGVLPAILLFIPYQLITGRSLWTPTAAVFLVTLFAIWGTALASRVIQRHFPHSSLGVALLSIIGFILGANTIFLLFRPDFYAVPLILALVITSAGLWCWLGARRVVIGVVPGKHHDRVVTRMWRSTDGDPIPRFTTLTRHSTIGSRDIGSVVLSRPRLIIGALLLTANIGSRPNFIFTVFLAFPIFWEEIRAGLFFSWLRPSAFQRLRARLRSKGKKTEKTQSVQSSQPQSVSLSSRSSSSSTQPASLSVWQSIPNDLCILLTGFLTLLPFLGYNYWRFGSFFDFGNKYQLTVTDLTNYSEPPYLMLPIAFYYLLEPIHIVPHFPFIGLVGTPLPSWQYVEPWMGGLIWLVPFTALSIAALCMHKTMVRRHMWPLVVSLFVLGIGGCLFDSYYAGLSLRYLADFGWIFAMLGLMGACGLESWARRVPETSPNSSSKTQKNSKKDSTSDGVAHEVSHEISHTVKVRLGVVHMIVALLVLIGVGMTFAIFLVPGRISDMLENVPEVYFTIRAALMGGLSVA
jgi:hypothetical protein